MSEQNLVAIVGPTASGKSALGVYLAERLGGEVVACDSTQLYRGFDIGTGKPVAGERRGIPHHLLDVLDASEAATAGGYRQMALPVLDDLRKRNRLPIFTVGTGLYLRVLLEGLADLPQRSEELRARLRADAAEHPAGHLHRVLERLDSEAARRIAAADEQKLIRAIEVCLLTQQSLSEAHRKGRNSLAGWRVLKIGLAPTREKLHLRIDARAVDMLARGWADEVRTLLAGGLSETAKPFDFIGYREVLALVRGETTAAAALTSIQQGTRRYAKRQATWFRKEAAVHWLTGFGDESRIQQHALSWLNDQGLRGGRAT
jgi:tRNA dimethylallyltransferase